MILQQHVRLRRVDDHRDRLLEVVQEIHARRCRRASHDKELERGRIDVLVRDRGSVPERHRACAGHARAMLGSVDVDLEGRCRGGARADDELGVVVYVELAKAVDVAGQREGFSGRFSNLQ